MRLIGWTVAAVMLSVAVPASAQGKKFEINLGGGYSAVTGEARQHTGDAGVFEAGVTFNGAPKFGFQVNYNYTGLGKEKTKSLAVSPIPGGATSLQTFSLDSHMHDVTFNAVWKAPWASRASPILIVGPGYYHRTINLTSPAVGYTTVCDPYWYVCYPAAVSVDKILGTRSANDFGMNFGIGVSFKVGDTARLYFDVRYQYIWGDSFDVPAVGATPAKTVRANGQTVPFVFGVSF